MIKQKQKYRKNSKVYKQNSKYTGKIQSPLMIKTKGKNNLLPDKFDHLCLTSYLLILLIKHMLTNPIVFPESCSTNQPYL